MTPNSLHNNTSGAGNPALRELVTLNLTRHLGFHYVNRFRRELVTGYAAAFAKWSRDQGRDESPIGRLCSLISRHLKGSETDSPGTLGLMNDRSEERRVGKECRSRWS